MRVQHVIRLEKAKFRHIWREAVTSMGGDCGGTSAPAVSKR